MSEYLIQADTLIALADAIRGKTGGVMTLTPAQMAAAIEAMELGVDTSDATAVAADILSGKTAYVNGQKLTGGMTNRGAVSKSLTSSGASYTIPAGYHNGSGKVTAEIANFGGLAKCQLVTATGTGQTASSLVIYHSLGEAPDGFVLSATQWKYPSTTGKNYILKTSYDKKNLTSSYQLFTVGVYSSSSGLGTSSYMVKTDAVSSNILKADYVVSSYVYTSDAYPSGVSYQCLIYKYA